MEFSNIEEILASVAKKRTELKDEDIDTLKNLLDHLKDAQDFVNELNDRLDRNIAKMEEVIDDLEIEQEEAEFMFEGYDDEEDEDY